MLMAHDDVELKPKRTFDSAVALQLPSARPDGRGKPDVSCWIACLGPAVGKVLLTV